MFFKSNVIFQEIIRNRFSFTIYQKHYNCKKLSSEIKVLGSKNSKCSIINDLMFDCFIKKRDVFFCRRIASLSDIGLMDYR